MSLIPAPPATFQFNPCEEGGVRRGWNSLMHVSNTRNLPSVLSEICCPALECSASLRRWVRGHLIPQVLGKQEACDSGNAKLSYGERRKCVLVVSDTESEPVKQGQNKSRVWFLQEEVGTSYEK